jgi:integrase
MGLTLASIRKRSWATEDGLKSAWQVDFVDQQGKRRHRQFQRRKDADRFLVTARHQVHQGTFTPDSSPATLGEAIELWLQRTAANRREPGTLDQYRQHGAHLLAAIPGETKLAKITPARAEQLRDDLLGRHSREMARKVLASFKAILKDAKLRGLVAQNVAAETTIGHGKRHKRKLEVGVDVPTPAQVKAMIEAGDPKARAMVCLAALAGLRASELRGVRWSDLQLGDQPTVTVAQRADARARIGSPKSAPAAALSRSARPRLTRSGAGSWRSRRLSPTRAGARELWYSGPARTARTC